MAEPIHMMAVTNGMDKGGRNLNTGLVAFLAKWRYALGPEAHHFTLEFGATLCGLGQVPELASCSKLAWNRPLTFPLFLFLGTLWNRALGACSRGELNHFSEALWEFGNM
jgi:hypothetical protein